ncbi:MAG: cobalamin-dependent protein [candidate division Zixibacteria bacterium]|nr:cobalamin-dependent protein [candidate division Zixibacteria bacterium]
MRDAGFKVIYTGLRQTPESIVDATIGEDVDVVGVSILSGAHITLFPAIRKLMQEKECDDILLIGGGIIPEDEITQLENQGIDKPFASGTTTDPIIEYVKKTVSDRKNSEDLI